MKEFLAQFRSPPPGYGNVAFYWWMGDPVTKERLAWQLERLRGMRTTGLQINYCHGEDGGLQWGLVADHSPRVFSEEWWELIGWFVEEAGRQGISVSLSDYTLGPPGQGYYMDRILRDRPELAGRKLEEEVLPCSAGDRLVRPAGRDLLAFQFVTADGGSVAEITGEFTAPADGRAVAVRVRRVSASLDPMHPDTGRELLRVAFQPFEDRFPGSMGKGFNYFFSDELNLGISGNLWNDSFREEFRARKGYDLLPEIAGLFADIGPRTEKIRLDYRDVMVSLEEAGFFEPVYRWQEERGMTYGCDHGGRGKNVTEFGDYFRTQKYNQGPGCDQPGLSSDVIKNKVASSIAHLYGRPRTWLEGFYGSGWGTTSGQLWDAIARNFAQGQNLLSLHALYYSTHGGYWEWAPPCNHFRMPYWACMEEVLGSAERLSWLLTRGRHVCDVAVVYPVAAVEADPAEGGKAVDAAFALGDALYARGIDFDFIDFESIAGGTVEGGCLLAGTERYRAVVLPAMKAARFAMIERLAELRRDGGLVPVVSCLPVASDRLGREDPVLDRLCHTLSEGLVPAVEDAVEGLARLLEPDISCDGAHPPYFMHRSLPEGELYFLYGGDKNLLCSFRAEGNALLLDPRTGEARRVPALCRGGGRTELPLPLEPEEPTLLLFTREDCADLPGFRTWGQPSETIPLPEQWDVTYLPTLDNAWGDFRLPASARPLGPEIREATVEAGGQERREILGFGAYWKLLALDRTLDSDEVAARFAAEQSDTLRLGGECIAVLPYAYSPRLGIKGDPGPQGYHGLKGKISNDFIGLGRRRENPTDYSYEDEGKCYYLKTMVIAEADETAFLIAGPIAPERIWLNGALLPASCRTVRLWAGPNDLMLRYAGPVRTHFLVSRTREPRWSRRGYPLSMDWYENPDLYPLSPEAPLPCRIRFSSPPGMEAMVFFAAAPPRVFANGAEVAATETGEALFSAREYRVAYAAPEPAEILIELEGLPGCGCAGADLLPEPVRFECGRGRISLGDWSNLEGLASYSGGLRYEATAVLRGTSGRAVRLRLGDVACACKVLVNGQDIGSRASGPWVFDLTGRVRDGENRIAVLVFNTLANQYQTIPTRYRGNPRAGLFGPVKLELY